MLLGSQGENQLIQRISDAFAEKQGRRSTLVKLGIGDDAALLRGRRGFETILTCDWFLEGLHFLAAKYPPDAVGWKCLARAISDVAAMGGQPRCFLLSLALPEKCTRHWLDHFLAGLRRAARRFRCNLAGGDITRWHQVLINITVVGEARSGHAVLRSGAVAGDVVFVSGRLGEAELGLRLLRLGKTQSERHRQWLKKHFYPEPRLALGSWLAEKQLATAMMDLSDGLSTDLPRLCAASGVGARLDAGKIPVVRLPNLKHTLGVDPLTAAVNGGDDYELLFTVGTKNAKRVPSQFRGLPLTAIGEVTKKKSISLVDEQGGEHALPARGWDPFR